MIASIQGRMIAFFSAFALLVAAIVLTTVVVLQGQADDGLVINLAGRQRMLTQKMSKESLMLANAAFAGQDSSLEERGEQLRQTMRLFEATLFALRDGGPAPLDMQMSQMRDTPAAEDKGTRDQLNQVAELWKDFKGHLNGVLSSGGRSQEDVDAVASKNLNLLKEMNVAVTLMQYSSEQKINRLYIVQAVAFLIAIALVIIGAYMAQAMISTPIQRLAEAAHAMSVGDLDAEVRVGGSREVDQLSRSFDRMRSSMLATLDHGGVGRAVGADDL